MLVTFYTEIIWRRATIFVGRRGLNFGKFFWKLVRFIRKPRHLETVSFTFLGRTMFPCPRKRILAQLLYPLDMSLRRGGPLSFPENLISYRFLDFLVSGAANVAG